MGPPSQQITCITADFDLLLPIFSSIQYQSDLSTVRQKECNHLSYTPRQKKILMIPASNLKGEQQHLKTQFAHHHRQVDYNNNHFISRQSTFSSRLWHFWGTFSSLLPFTKYLPSIRRPNSCNVVWQQLICQLVLSASLSLPLIGCPWFTKSGIFVDSHTKQRT